ncbi:MAG: SGNH/GDSL hydrolase family protein [Chthoniobacteraceae bacterium]
MNSLRALALLLAFLPAAMAEDFLPGVTRILFLGDSITYAGHYVDDFDLFLATKYPGRRFEVIDCGLPSETVSGLSEAGHAGGKFPRPDLHERLDRVLAIVKPDLIFACYGMNCGIYLPFSEERFAKYQEGIRKLREKARNAGAQIIHLTPPVFDPLPIKARVKPAGSVKDGDMFEGYNGVLDRYSEWLVAQGKSEGWRVIDTHNAMAAALETARKANPEFTFSKDGVHANEAGHHVMAVTILKALGAEFDPDITALAELRKLIRKRGRLLTDAYLNAAGHKRPGMAKGLPLEEARAKAAEIDAQLREAAAKIPAK